MSHRHLSRRRFLARGTATTLAFAALLHATRRGAPGATPADGRFGPLVRDPKSLLDLPKGFSYRVVSRTGDEMSDGFLVPGAPD